MIEELIEFITVNSDSKVVVRIDDFTTFVTKSYQDLSSIKKRQNKERTYIYIDKSFKPLTINVKRAIDMISKFEMLPSQSQKTSARGLPPLKFPQLTRTESIPHPRQISRGSSQTNNSRLSSSHGFDKKDFLQPGNESPPKLITEPQIKKENLNPKKPLLKVAPKQRFSGLRSPAHTSMKKCSSGLLVPVETAEIQSSINLPTILRKPHILLFGDHPFILKFDLEKNRWSKSKVTNKNAELFILLKYMCVVPLPTNKAYFIGGCNRSTNEATNEVFEKNFNQLTFVSKKKNCLEKRYAHNGIFTKAYIYIIGGFNHSDTDTAEPSTLSHCEKYSPIENKWLETAHLRESRAMMGALSFNDKYIYVFGGCHNEEVLSSIEKYEISVDDWTLLSYRLPKCLAKFGSILVEDMVYIVGGITETFDDTDEVITINLTNWNFGTLTNMKHPRAAHNNIWMFNSQIYVIGGNQFYSSEKYDLKSGKWTTIPSYTSVIDNNELETFCGFIGSG